MVISQFCVQPTVPLRKIWEWYIIQPISTFEISTKEIIIIFYITACHDCNSAVSKFYTDHENTTLTINIVVSSKFKENM